MPEDAATPSTMAAANPFDPSTMPEGTVIRVDSSNFSETEFSATFREISVANNLSEHEGSSLVVERVDADVVRVTTGPTEGIDAYTSVGVDFEFASASLANNTSLNGSTFQSAEFDLSTPQGREAYNDFLVTGSMPGDNGTGVANVQTVQTIDYHSQTDLQASLGPVDFTFEGGANTVNSVVITQPDGTSTQTLRASYFDGLPLTISRRFEANGTEIMADRTYSYELEATTESAQLLNVVSTGDVASADSGPIEDGDTVTITLTHAQMVELQQLTGDTVNAVEHSHTLDDIAESETPLDFALHLARNFSDSGQELAETLFTISSGADGDVRNDFEALPIDIDVQARTHFLASIAARIAEQQGANG